MTLNTRPPPPCFQPAERHQRGPGLHHLSGYLWLRHLRQRGGLQRLRLVLEIEGSKDTGFKTDRAKLVLTDGSVKTVDLSKDYKNDKSIDQYDIVTYKVDEDNEYVLKEVKLTQSVTNSATFDLENDVARITTGGSSNSKNTVYANSKTMFVVRDDSKDYTAYTGVKNAPSVKAQDLSIGGSGIDNAKEQVSATGTASPATS